MTLHFRTTIRLLRKSSHPLARAVLAAGPEAVALQNDGDELTSLAALTHLRHCETRQPPPFSMPATQYKGNLWTSVRHGDMEWIGDRWTAAGIPLPDPAYAKYIWRPGPTVSLLATILEKETTQVGRAEHDKNSWPDFGPGAAIHLSSNADPVTMILKADSVIEGAEHRGNDETLVGKMSYAAARGEVTPSRITSWLADEFCAEQRYVAIATALTPAHLAALRAELPWPLRELDRQYPCLILKGTAGSCHTAPVCAGAVGPRALGASR